MGLQRVSDGVRVGAFGGLHKDTHIGQRGLHVVFIPWDTSEGAEWNTKTNNWNHARANKFKIVNWSSGAAAHPDLVAVGNDPAGVVYIRGHGNPGLPYIMANHKPVGHNNPLGLVLPITVACQRLIDSGLDKDFAGAIKFYSCHSGAKPTAAEFERLLSNWREEQRNYSSFLDSTEKKLKALGTVGGSVAESADKATQRANLGIEKEKYLEVLKKSQPETKSLARQGADYMRGKGFKRCAFYGYLGPLGSTYEFDTDTDLTTVHKTVALEGLEKRPKRLQGLDACRPSVARVRV